MKRKNERGSAILESLPVTAMLVVFAVGILLAAYLTFTRAWIQYHSEQALYCAAEGKPSFLCKTELERKLATALPWGRSVAEVRSWSDNWTVEVEWTYRDHKFHLVKLLSPNRILKARALRW